MKTEEFPKVEELPSPDRPIGVYIGLILGGFITALGAAILFRESILTFKNVGLELTTVTVFRLVLMLLSAYASMACFYGLFRLIKLQRTLAWKVGEEFKHFVIYARPMIEEVIRLRLISERLGDRMKYVGRRTETPSNQIKEEIITPNRAEFLVWISIMSSATVGLFLYLDRHPWATVPYSLMFLAMAWWVVIAGYFGMIDNFRSYYIPAVFILLIPTLSIVLRGYIEVDQVLLLMFLLLIPYIMGMYTVYSYTTTRRMPDFIPRIFKREGVADELKPKDRAELSAKIRESLPPKKKK